MYIMLALLLVAKELAMTPINENPVLNRVVSSNIQERKTNAVRSLSDEAPRKKTIADAVKKMNAREQVGAAVTSGGTGGLMNTIMNLVSPLLKLFKSFGR